MYQFLPGEEKYFDQIIPLFYETGYFENSAVDNKLNLPAAEFYKVQVLRPYLRYTSVLVDSNEEFVGYCIAATGKQVREVEKSIPNGFREDPQWIDFDNQLNHFYAEELSDKHLVEYSVALHPKYRGKGLYKLLHRHCQSVAEQNHCSKIALLVWQSNPAHLIYKHYGIKYVGKIDCPAIPDVLLKGVFDLDMRASYKGT